MQEVGYNSDLYLIQHQLKVIH